MDPLCGLATLAAPGLGIVSLVLLRGWLLDNAGVGPDCRRCGYPFVGLYPETPCPECGTNRSVQAWSSHAVIDGAAVGMLTGALALPIAEALASGLTEGDFEWRIVGGLISPLVFWIGLMWLCRSLDRRQRRQARLCVLLTALALAWPATIGEVHANRFVRWPRLDSHIDALGVQWVLGGLWASIRWGCLGGWVALVWLIWRARRSSKHGPASATSVLDPERN